jgi:hypothetical protein
MLTNELKNGDRVKLRNGWFATVKDNKKGNTRLCEVEGTYTEMGSVYAHDIAMYFPKLGPAVCLSYTDAQTKLRKQCEAFGF